MENVLGAEFAKQVHAFVPRGTKSTVRIVLVGDSTVTDTDGWGPGFTAAFRDGAVEVANLAQNGRSSRSYRHEGHWDKALAQPADYVLLQFGHNDQPGKGPERETDPGTTYRANMRRYVEEARSRGMKPVLVTSLTRRQFGRDGKIGSTLGPYVDAVKQVAAETTTPVIDLHALSIALCESLGPEGCKAISPMEKGKIDATHLNAKGAERIGSIVAKELVKVVPELAPHVKMR